MSTSNVLYLIFTMYHCFIVTHSSLPIMSNQTLSIDMRYYPTGTTTTTEIKDGTKASTAHYRYFRILNGKCIAPKLRFELEKIDIDRSFGHPEQVDVYYHGYLINRCTGHPTVCGEWFTCIDAYDFGYGYYQSFENSTVMIQITKHYDIGAACAGLSLNGRLSLTCSEPPTFAPTSDPTLKPTNLPTDKPTNLPTLSPTDPTLSPTKKPTMDPSFAPSEYPTNPTSTPTIYPSHSPTTITMSPTSATASPTTATLSPTTKQPTMKQAVAPDDPSQSVVFNERIVTVITVCTAIIVVVSCCGCILMVYWKRKSAEKHDANIGSRNKAIRGHEEGQQNIVLHGDDDNDVDDHLNVSGQEVQALKSTEKYG